MKQVIVSAGANVYWRVFYDETVKNLDLTQVVGKGWDPKDLRINSLGPQVRVSLYSGVDQEYRAYIETKDGDEVYIGDMMPVTMVVRILAEEISWIVEDEALQIFDEASNVVDALKSWANRVYPDGAENRTWSVCMKHPETKAVMLELL